MTHTIKRFIRDEQGEDLIEYGLLAAFVAGVAIAVLMNHGIRDALDAAFQRAQDALSDTATN